MSEQVKIEYVLEELASLQKRFKDRLAAMPMSFTSSTAGDLEVFLEAQTKESVYRRYILAIKKGLEAKTDAELLFLQIRHRAVRELAQQAGNSMSRSTSWAANESQNYTVVALGIVVSLFMALTEEPTAVRT